MLAKEFLTEGAKFLPASKGFKYEVKDNWIGRPLSFDQELAKSLLAAYATQEKADPTIVHQYFIDAQARAKTLYETAATTRMTTVDRKTRALYGYTSVVIAYAIGELDDSRDFAEIVAADPLIPEELRVKTREMLDEPRQIAA
jgi:hypothetical protein